MPRPPLVKMALDRNALPVPETTATPAPVLNAITLPEPAAVPPIVLPEAPTIRDMPLPTFGRARLPAASVPMALPRTVLLDEPEIVSPLPPLPEITLRALASVPPIVLPEAPEIRD